MDRTVFRAIVVRPSIAARMLAAAVLTLLCGTMPDRVVAQPSVAPLYGLGTTIERGQPGAPSLDDRSQNDTVPRAAEPATMVIALASDSAVSEKSVLHTRALCGGRFDRNAEERDQRGNLAAERRYERDSVATGTTIVDGLALEGITDLPVAHVPVEIVVIGHLEEEFPQAHPDSAVLWIDAISTSAGGSAIDCRTLGVRAGDLMRRSPCESFDRYQQSTLALDMTACDAGDDARLRAGSSAPARASIRVRYAGNATIAIQSVTMRPVRALPASKHAAGRE